MKKETYNSGFYECPYCGYKDYDAWELELNDGDSIVIECPSCGRKIEVTAEIEVYYKAVGYNEKEDLPFAVQNL